MSSDFCACCKRPTPDCNVMAELRRYRTPEGRASLVAEYRAEVIGRQGALEANPEMDAWRHAQKAGVPVDALLQLRRKPKGLAITAAEQFCSPEGRQMATFLLLLGDAGVGKTTAAAHVVLDFCQGWNWNSQPTGGIIHPVQWLDAAALTRMSAFGDADRELTARLHAAPLLVLEDAGQEGTELGKGVFCELVMARDAKKRRTVISSNLPSIPFKARYGEAVAGRIRAAGIIPLLAGVKSMRQKPRFA